MNGSVAVAGVYRVERCATGLTREWFLGWFVIGGHLTHPICRGVSRFSLVEDGSSGLLSGCIPRPTEHSLEIVLEVLEKVKDTAMMGCAKIVLVIHKRFGCN
jgi:hypothetical protein